MIESKKRAFIFLFLAFLLALVAGYLVYDKVKDLNSELGGMTKVYVAKGDIPSRTLIKENQIQAMEIPNKFVTESHVTGKLELKDRVSVVPLSDGDIITTNMIKPASNLNNENDRVVAIYRNDKIQFDQVIAALDRIDIIVSREVNGERKTELFMEDVPVSYAEGDEKSFAGVAVVVPKEKASELIHVQNYAEHIRILKANVGKESEPAQTETTSEAKPEEKPKEETKKEDKPASQDKPKESNQGDTTNGKES
ncbi:flagella basal body P-ring formation protein FlgA [Bacillus sp. Marseille-Q1617]|uniref:flagella basal body P-ring formation protein FlgA n=1 Tax=Bacillus sp. Marseille-Q1617 TaxID=2736887 RepID=UPI0015884E02|nr:flagella basal body P-ring formation protein FlgA [Bacillus sp. Marseille-Q1617]